MDTPPETLCCFTLDVITYMKGQHSAYGDVVLKRLPCPLLDGNDTLQLVFLVYKCDVANVSDCERGVVGPTYLLDLIEHLYQLGPIMLTCLRRPCVLLWRP